MLLKMIASKPACFLFSCLFICACTSPAISQYYFYNSQYYDALFTAEGGLSGGAMNCLTDLGGRHEQAKNSLSDVNWRTTQPCAGLFAAINYNGIVGLRAELAFGQVSAADSILKHYTAADNGRYLRNLSFSSVIREVSLLAEWYPLGIFPSLDLSLCPYLVAGAGIFDFNPQAVLNRTWVSLPALHTEGEGWMEYPERRPYKLTQLNVPVGGGVKYELGPLFTLRCEFIYRWLFTDYLDDVSTTYVNPARFDVHLNSPIAALAEKLADRRRERGAPSANHTGEIRGNSSNKDAFFSVNVKCSFVMGRKKIR
ncbi:MAG: hypothetical protein INR73_27640 [Williamsia sp.]|nr:hypothetical protein [Williamsia sp.]